MIVHLDGDLIVYRAGFAAEKMHYYLIQKDEEYEDDVAKHFQYQKDLKKYITDHELEEKDYTIEARREVEPLKNALYNVKSLIKDCLDHLEAGEDELIVYLSGPDNYRNGVATLKPYKGNRDKQHRPVHADAIKQFMQKRYNVVMSVNEEADDVVGYSHYKMWLEDEHSSVIATVDKDIDMIPGMHYNFVKEKAYYVTPDTADWYFLRQLLTGESTDNIPGVPGIGNVKAEAALGLAEDNVWDAIVALYVQGYGDNWYDALVEN